MNAFSAAFALPLALLFAAGVHAQAPAGAPAGSTGLCKDGSYTDAATRRGACRGHQGIKDWYAADAASAAKAGASVPPATRGSAVPASPPAGSSGLCKDGTYTDAAAKKGACRGHQGVKEWYGASAASNARAAAPAPATPPAAPPTTPAPAAPMPMPMPARPATPAPSAPASSTAAPGAPAAPPIAAAPGGGAGKVWVNLETKVYHCPSDRYYGRTKQGQYMSEAQAQAAGNHAAHGKTCSP